MAAEQERIGRGAYSAGRSHGTESKPLAKKKLVWISLVSR